MTRYATRYNHTSAASPAGRSSRRRRREKRLRDRIVDEIARQPSTTEIADRSRIAVVELREPSVISHPPD